MSRMAEQGTDGFLPLVGEFIEKLGSSLRGFGGDLELALVVGLNDHGGIVFVLINRPDLVEINSEELVVVQGHRRDSHHNPLGQNPRRQPSAWFGNKTE